LGAQWLQLDDVQAIIVIFLILANSVEFIQVSIDYQSPWTIVYHYGDMFIVLCVMPVMVIATQVESHPFMSNSKLIEFSQRYNIQVTAFSPLAKPARSWYDVFTSL